MCEIFDGFGSHLNNYEANKLRADNKILSLKEEGDSSSVNQAYDKEVARSDKNVQRDALSVIRKWTNLLNQWDLVVCGCAAVRHTANHPEIWEGSFVAVNLHPLKQIPFPEWCKKIEPFMQASDGYDLFTRDDGNIDLYKLLPILWQTMSTEQKTNAVSTVQKYDGAAWGIDCIRELCKVLSVLPTDLPSLQPSIFLAIEDPSHLTRGYEEDDPPQASADEEGDQIVADVEAARVKANNGLIMFQRNPPGLEGEELFFHQINFRQRQFAMKPEEHSIGAHLMVSPRTRHQEDLMDIDYHLKMQGSMWWDVNEGGVPLRKAAQVRLDNLGQIKCRSTLINDDVRLERLKFRFEMQRSIGHLDEVGKAASAEKRDDEKKKIRGLLKNAIRMYIDGNLGRALTKDHIRSILLFIFDSPNASKSAKKDILLKELDDAATKQPNLLIEAADEHSLDVLQDTVPPALPPLTAQSLIEAEPVGVEAEPVVGLGTTEKRSLDDEVTPLAAPAPPALETAAALTNPSVKFLYDQCQKLKDEIGSPVDTLELAMLALPVIDKTRLESVDKELDTNYIKGLFRKAYRSQNIGNKNVSDDFINAIVGKWGEFIEEEELTGNELRKRAAWEFGQSWTS